MIRDAHNKLWVLFKRFAEAIFKRFAEALNHLTLIWNIDGLMQERRNFIANELELRLSCINPSIWCKRYSLNKLKQTRWIKTERQMGAQCIKVTIANPLVLLDEGVKMTRWNTVKKLRKRKTPKQFLCDVDNITDITTIIPQCRWAWP